MTGEEKLTLPFPLSANNPRWHPSSERKPSSAYCIVLPEGALGSHALITAFPRSALCPAPLPGAGSAAHFSSGFYVAKRTVETDDEFTPLSVSSLWHEDRGLSGLHGSLDGCSFPLHRPPGLGHQLPWALWPGASAGFPPLSTSRSCHS